MDNVTENDAADVLVLGEDGTDGLNAAVRDLLEDLVNVAIDEQASELGMPSNGYRERALNTRAGEIALRIPKLRSGSFFPDDVIERHQRVDRASLPPSPRCTPPARAPARCRG